MNKEYHIWNKKVSKEEFKKEWQKFLALSHQDRQVLIEKFRSFLPQFPKRFAITKQLENSTGNYLVNSKNAYECFGGSELEDCAYCFYFKHGGKSCHDLTQFGYNVELSYYCQAVGLDSYNIRFSNLVWESQNMTYCDQCFASQDCWLSVGLKKNKYCVFNKQYTKEEYERLVPKLQRKLEEEYITPQPPLKQEGEKLTQWGNFFPPKISTYGYNQSWAYEYFPLTKREALEQDYAWIDVPEATKYQGPKNDVSQNIADISDSILDQILTCYNTGKNYRIVQPELSFYRKIGLPIPRICPDERHRLRVEIRLPDVLHERPCDHCSQMMSSVYSEERPEKVLCEKCYLKEVQ